MKHALIRVIGRVKESAVIAQYGDGLLAKIRIFCTLLVRDNRRAFPLTFRMRRGSVRFTLSFRSHADLMLFHEIFGGHPYRLPKDVSPEYIVDLGANTGISTLYLHTSYPHAHIAAVEANPDLLPRLHEVLKGVPNIVVLPYAASGHDGVVSFYVQDENPLGSSLLKRAEERREIQVPVRTLESLRREAGFPRIDFAKFDIEGAEWDVFTTYPHRGELQAFAGEVHEDLMGTSKDAFARLWPHLTISYVPTLKKERFVVYGIRT